MRSMVIEGRYIPFDATGSVAILVELKRSASAEKSVELDMDTAEPSWIRSPANFMWTLVGLRLPPTLSMNWTPKARNFYESMLKEMRDAAGDSGEFYTPRAVVKFIVAA